MMHIWPGEIWELWGEIRPLKGPSVNVPIAVFFTEESALEYIEKSRLKKKGFRKKSLLRHASRAWVEVREELPIEPSL